MASSDESPNLTRGNLEAWKKAGAKIPVTHVSITDNVPEPPLPPENIEINENENLDLTAESLRQLVKNTKDDEEKTKDALAGIMNHIRTQALEGEVSIGISLKNLQIGTRLELVEALTKKGFDVNELPDNNFEISWEVKKRKLNPIWGWIFGLLLGSVFVFLFYISLNINKQHHNTNQTAPQTIDTPK